jgi:hypothetical protein
MFSSGAKSDGKLRDSKESVKSGEVWYSSAGVSRNVDPGVLKLVKVVDGGIES